MPDTLPCVNASCNVELLSNAVLAIPTQLSPSYINKLPVSGLAPILTSERSFINPAPPPPITASCCCVLLMNNL